MARIETWFTQDLKRAVKVRYLDGNVFSADNAGNVVGVNVFDEGQPATLTGSVSGSVIRADGATVAVVGALSGNKASIVLPQSAYAIPGAVSIVIKLTNGTDVTTLCAVVSNVYLSTTDTVVDPGTIIPDISTLVAEIEAAVASIPADYSELWETIAPNYSSSSTYSVGQYATYDGKLYKCVVAIATPESWTEAHWEQVAYGDEVFNINNSIFKTQQTIATMAEGNSQKNYRFPERVTSDMVDIMDDSGNVIAAIDYQGYFKAKSFDASKSVMSCFPYSPVPYNLAIKDDNDNIAFAIVNGLAITNQRLYGKNLAIIGDSISTFAGYIPEGYATYYPSGNLDSVTKTWWFKLVNELGLNLIRDAAWSGSRVSGDSQGTAYAACSDARVNALVGDNQEVPDIIICYISTNDWANGIPVGSFTDQDVIPSEGVINEISKAYALMLYKLRTRYPAACVYCVTNLEGRRTSGDTSYPIVNGRGETIHEVNHAITEIAHIFGCHVIDLNVSGIHYWNVASYTVDGTLHPNTAGAEIIKEVVKQTLINTYHNM